MFEPRSTGRRHQVVRLFQKISCCHERYSYDDGGEGKEVADDGDHCDYDGDGGTDDDNDADEEDDDKDAEPIGSRRRARPNIRPTKIETERQGEIIEQRKSKETRTTNLRDDDNQLRA